VAQQLREAAPFGKMPKYIIRDNDAKFGTRFDGLAKGTGVEVLKIPYRAPRANAICERFLGSVRRECLDHSPLVGEGQLYRVIREYVQCFNRARPHQRIGQHLPAGSRAEGSRPSRGKIPAFPILNGLHHDYRRAA
jgi:transposase InsO family protein